MQLSPNFDLSEFEKDSTIPIDCITAFQSLAVGILEPTRDFAKAPITMTSGYRSPEANAEAHGQPNSEHMATPDFCACDFFPVGVPVRQVFDWMRTNPILPFHQLILEHGKNSTVIHVSWNRLKPGVRSVLEGATHNAQPYVKMDHVAYQPPADLSLQGDV